MYVVLPNITVNRSSDFQRSQEFNYFIGFLET